MPREHLSEKGTALPPSCCSKVCYAQHLVKLSGEEVGLTPIEYRLLAYLTHNVGRVMTQDLLLEHVWGSEYDGESHMLQVNVNRLRTSWRPILPIPAIF